MFGNAENRQSRSVVGGEEAGRCEDISDSDVNMKTEPVKTDMMSTVLLLKMNCLLFTLKM